MERWSGAFKEIRVRKFDDIESLVPSGMRYDFAERNEQLKDFLAETWAADAKPNVVFSFPGREAEYANCFFAAHSKFIHVLDCSRSLFERGALTWGLVDAYHASLLGARSILSALGVCLFKISGRSVLVDFFPDHGRVDDKKSFKKQHGNVESPIRILAPSKDLILEQKKIWELVERVIALKSFASSEEETIQLTLKELLKAKPWHGRHEVLYDLSAWRWKDDIGLLSLSKSELETLIAGTDEEVIVFSQFIDQVFILNKIYADVLLRRTVGGSITLPPDSLAVSTPTVLV